jgi:class 3 adenylate cyclase
VKSHSDPEKYRRLSAPRSVEETNKAINDFFDELGAIREKHGMADVTCVIGVKVQHTEKVGDAVTLCHYGDSTNQERLLAWALGQAQAERRELINSLLSGEKPTPA